MESDSLHIPSCLMQYTQESNDIRIVSVSRAVNSPVAYDMPIGEITSTVKKWTSIPVSLGLDPTMTLAKIANDLAKKRKGICSLLDPAVRTVKLAELDIGDVWGIGRRLAPKMVRLGIRTAQDLAATDPLWIRKQFTVVQERLVLELNGEHCLDMATVPAARKNIQVSRSFHNATDDFDVLAEGVATFAAKACEQARSEGTAASAVHVHLNTSWHRKQHTFVSDGKTKGFHYPTAHSPEVIRAALGVLREIYREGSCTKKQR